MKPKGKTEWTNGTASVLNVRPCLFTVTAENAHRIRAFTLKRQRPFPARITVLYLLYTRMIGCCGGGGGREEEPIRVVLRVSG